MKSKKIKAGQEYRPMAEYRHKETGEVKTHSEWAYHYRGVTKPNVWDANTLDFLKLEAVLEAPKPSVGQYEIVVRDGVVKDAKGNWVKNWAVRAMFSDYTDDEGVTHTKAEQEAAYQARLDADAAKAVRAERDRLISETDYFALTDTTMTLAMTQYRQALRDITAHASFPYLAASDWPVKPE